MCLCVCVCVSMCMCVCVCVSHSPAICRSPRLIIPDLHGSSQPSRARSASTRVSSPTIPRSSFLKNGADDHSRTHHSRSCSHHCDHLQSTSHSSFPDQNHNPQRRLVRSSRRSSSQSIVVVGVGVGVVGVEAVALVIVAE